MINILLPVLLNVDHRVFLASYLWSRTCWQVACLRKVCTRGGDDECEGLDVRAASGSATAAASRPSRASSCLWPRGLRSRSSTPGYCTVVPRVFKTILEYGDQLQRPRRHSLPSRAPVPAALSVRS